MARKKPVRDEDEEQSKKFIELAKELEAAGDLSPTEAEAALEKTMSGVAILHRQWLEGEEDQESPP